MFDRIGVWDPSRPISIFMWLFKFVVRLKLGYDSLLLFKTDADYKKRRLSYCDKRPTVELFLFNKLLPACLDSSSFPFLQLMVSAFRHTPTFDYYQSIASRWDKDRKWLCFVGLACMHLPLAWNWLRTLQSNFVQFCFIRCVNDSCLETAQWIVWHCFVTFILQ